MPKKKKKKEKEKKTKARSLQSECVVKFALRNITLN
jgi:hypothetical protein